MLSEIEYGAYMGENLFSSGPNLTCYQLSFYGEELKCRGNVTSMEAAFYSPPFVSWEPFDTEELETAFRAPNRSLAGWDH